MYRVLLIVKHNKDTLEPTIVYVSDYAQLWGLSNEILKHECGCGNCLQHCLSYIAYSIPSNLESVSDKDFIEMIEGTDVETIVESYDLKRVR